jgi:Ca-activated chloride channel family protein
MQMDSMPRRGIARRLAGLAAMLALVLARPAGGAGPDMAGGEERNQGFRFRSAVDLVNVTVTVTDASGRFVPGLQASDFRVYENGEPQTVTHFSNERVPVSLGITLDTSGSMAGDKIVSARQALDRFLFELLDPDDEVFLYRFTERADLLVSWTRDRQRVSRALAGIAPRGGTALYDAVAEAVPLAQTGEHRKKAVLIISDGNDTSSEISARDLKQLVRETEVLVYAIGIDGRGEPTFTSGGGAPRLPIPIPFPIPGRRPGGWPGSPPRQPPVGGGRASWGGDDRVNAAALRDITDDSGGRTEIVRSARDLGPATANIADELSKQYYLGYSSTLPRDGRWHTIEVRVRDGAYRVRARRGYMAAP